MCDAERERLQRSKGRKRLLRAAALSAPLTSSDVPAEALVDIVAPCASRDAVINNAELVAAICRPLAGDPRFLLNAACVGSMWRGVIEGGQNCSCGGASLGSAGATSGKSSPATSGCGAPPITRAFTRVARRWSSLAAILTSATLLPSTSSSSSTSAAAGSGCGTSSRGRSTVLPRRRHASARRLASRGRRGCSARCCGGLRAPRPTRTTSP
eukprot:7378736-Prymnesium_polylepis.1